MYSDEKSKLLKQFAFNTAASVGSLVSFYVAGITEGLANNIFTSVGIGLATLGLVGTVIAQIYNHRLQSKTLNYEREVAVSKKASEGNSKEESITFSYDEILRLILAGMQKSPVLLTEYPETYYKAKLLKEYVLAIAYPGYESMITILDSLMDQLRTVLDDDTLHDYEILIFKIENKVYKNALNFYNLPTCEDTSYNLDELLQKARVLEDYIQQTAYYGYEADIDYLYQALREGKEGNITPGNFNEWIHYIADKAYNSVLEASIAR